LTDLLQSLQGPFYYAWTDLLQSLQGPLLK
jgi:hypothetical protein